MLRKWILPQFSTPIMMIKQLIAILICFYGLPYFSSMSNWAKSFFFFGTVAFITTLLFGHQNLVVAIYGCLPFWFGLPVCFIMSKIISYKDLIRIGKIIVYTSIVNSILLILQFSLPVEHIINYQGAEIEESLMGASVSELQGAFRPSGLFQHNSQNSLYQMLSCAFLLFFIFLRNKVENNRVYWAILVIQIISLFFTISRTTILYHIGVICFFILFCMNGNQKLKLLKIIPFFLIIALFLSFIPLVRVAASSLTNRFSVASQSQFEGVSTVEGTMLDIFHRNVLYNIEALFNPHTINGSNVPFFGYGQGMSTQVGARLLGLNENSGFYLAEWDGLRIICESGLFLGWILIIIRVGYSFRYLFQIRNYQRQHKPLSLSLLPVFFVCFYLLTNWGNLFQSNFSFLVGGLFLASVKFRIYSKPLP